MEKKMDAMEGCLEMGTEGKGRNVSNSVLAQVARRAKVSSGTVSRVFNNSDLIPEGTRSRVLAAARELKFRPRVGIRAPQVALITEPPQKTVMGGYVSSLTQYICHALSRADAGVTMITEDRIEKLGSSWFDGIIGVSWEDKTIETLRGIQNIPIVWLCDQYCDVFHSIFVDGRETGRLAGEYLVSRGHRRIAVIHDVDYTGTLRAEGLAEAMAARGGSPATELLRLPNSMPLHLAVKQLICAGCTAVWVTGEDMKVLEVNWLIQELAGKKVPDEISILGFENPGISEFCRPSLSTIVSPLREMAEEAVRLALGENTDERVKVRMSNRVIERNSVAFIK